MFKNCVPLRCTQMHTEKQYPDIKRTWAYRNSWAYINFIQCDKVILVPGLGEPILDGAAMQQFRKLFPQYPAGNIVMIPMRQIVEEGGCVKLHFVEPQT